MNIHGSFVAHEKTPLAVDGHGICFYFGRKKESPILNNVNITVNRGTIYSLLGPSGCGKTTLLKCIVGQHQPQTGSLKVYGRKPGSKGFFIPGRGVGYMPQDLALYTEMSIEEMLTYFGCLYGMSMKNIRERITFLVQLLQLPEKKRLIQNLSGGQQRRVSFAIALIHKPPLLVLDEPTVGVDPLLRRAIWDHLISLGRNEHLTIIITTHYTEEARQAQTVGLMRNGHLLVARNPEDLIKQYGGFTLEDVFLKLCQKNPLQDEDHETNINELIVETNSVPKCLATDNAASENAATDQLRQNKIKFVKTYSGSFDQRCNGDEDAITLLPLGSLATAWAEDNFSTTSPWMRLFYLTRKNLLRIRRNIPLVLFIVSVSAFVVTLFYLCFAYGPFDLQIAVLNEEGDINKFGEKFLLSISNHTIYKKPFHNFTLAYESVQNGESWAALRIGSEFSTCLVDRILEGGDTSNDTIRCSTIEVILDVSNEVIAGTIRRTLWESYQEFAKKLLESLGANSLSGVLPLNVEEYTHSSKPTTFAEFVTPAVILCVMYILPLTLSEMSMLAERKCGLLSRTFVAGATTTEVLLSFFFGLLVVVILQIIVTLAVTFLVLNVPCNGPLLWVIIAVVLTGFGGLSYGLLISSLTDNEDAACLIAFGSFFPILLLCGVMWPLEAMPYYFRYFNNCLPLTRLIIGLRSVMIRGWNITDNYTWDGYVISSFWILVQATLAITFFKIKK